MGKDWVNELLKRRTQRLQDAQQQAQLTTMAHNYAPDMFRRLCSQIQQDVQRYAQGAGIAVFCNLRDNTCEVKYERFPTFWLQISFGTSGFSVIQTIKKSSSAQEIRKEFTILIIGKSQDEFYYRIDGEDKTSESEVSEYLLAPLFESIEST